MAELKYHVFMQNRLVRGMKINRDWDRVSEEPLTANDLVDFGFPKGRTEFRDNDFNYKAVIAQEG